MSKRMQILVDASEYRSIKRVAQRKGLTVSEWVRQTLRAACREVPAGSVEKKLAAIRSAAGHSFPTGDIGQMLEEIRAGSLEGLEG